MANTYFVFIFIFFAICEISKSVDLDCKFSIAGGYTIVGSVYICTSSNPKITSQESAQINKITGTHENSKSNDDVLGFHSENQVVHYFPKDLSTYFKNLKSIAIWRCGLKEIHQSDLKPFTKLVYLYIYANDIEILEEGLLDYNINLELIGIDNSKIFHIDPNIFDNLMKLTVFWFGLTPCIGHNLSTKSEINQAIINVKSKCVSPEFTMLDKETKILETESAILNFTEFAKKLTTFEDKFKKSKFFNFRPLNNKFQNLKNIKIDSSINELILSHDNVSTTMKVHADSLLNLTKSQTSIQSSLANLTVQFDDLKTSHTAMNQGIDRLNLSKCENKNFTMLKTSQDEIKSSLDNLSSKFTKNEVSHEQMKSSISDIEVTLSDVKISQNEVLSSLFKMKTSQNEIKLAVNDIRSNKADNSEEKNSNLNEKLENLKENIANFETKALEKIEMEMSNTRHKISLSVDEKIKGIEKRLMKKFEETLEEKLGKILEAKLGQILGDKLGN